jgi:hypothetical protein
MNTFNPFLRSGATQSSPTVRMLFIDPRRFSQSVIFSFLISILFFPLLPISSRCLSHSSSLCLSLRPSDGFRTRPLRAPTLTCPPPSPLPRRLYLPLLSVPYVVYHTISSTSTYTAVITTAAALCTKCRIAEAKAEAFGTVGVLEERAAGVSPSVVRYFSAPPPPPSSTTTSITLSTHFMQHGLR